ncbi:MAG: hypothetical protein EG823_09465 [Actinobacteria bacterium]|nr:hypothetical protein [Actinomycetota bacterium]
MSDVDGRIHNNLTMTFTRKSVGEHVLGLLRRWHSLLLTALAIFGVIWTMFEAPAYLLDADLRGARFYFGAVLASLLASVMWTVRQYLNDWPEGFEHESKAAKRIAHLQRTRWEHRLARQLLNDVLADLDDELGALLDGKVFVPITSNPDFAGYISWVGLAPASLLNMIDVAQQLVVMDLPSQLGAADLKTKEQGIRSAVYRIRDLYEATVEFERSRRAVQPPEGAERLHELQLGWTEPVRESVKQTFDFIDKVLATPSKGNHEVSFTVVIREPDNMDEFGRELKRLEMLGLHLA